MNEQQKHELENLAEACVWAMAHDTQLTVRGNRVNPFEVVDVLQEVADILGLSIFKDEESE